MFRTTRLIHVLLLVLWCGALHAAVPTSMSFQGYLTDRDGVPESDDTLITFSIYTIETGGTPLWDDTLLVQVENGLFSVELGRPSNPFPVGLFETPLWIGITVESDAEMIPRRPLTTAGFAFKADDSNSVQGKSATDLDQSSHVENLDNPHSVTAIQTGAIPQSALDAHTEDVTNPHQVTASQTGAIDSATFSAHSADSSAHHERYSGTEAFSAVLSMAGPGSGLDADTVDGIEEIALQDGISTNSAAIAVVQDEISQFSGQLIVRADGVAIGNLVDLRGSITRPDTALIASSKGYLFEIWVRDTFLGSQIEAFVPHYTTTDCTGQAPINSLDIHQIAVRTGLVLRSVFSPDPLRYSIDPNTSVIAATMQSAEPNQGGCVAIGSLDATWYPVLPNEPSVTGVSNAAYPGPITIGPQ